MEVVDEEDCSGWKDEGGKNSAYFASFRFLLMDNNVIVEVLLAQHEICTKYLVGLCGP